MGSSINARRRKQKKNKESMRSFDRSSLHLHLHLHAFNYKKKTKNPVSNLIPQHDAETSFTIRLIAPLEERRTFEWIITPLFF